MESGKLLITAGATFLVAICYLLVGVAGNPTLMLAAGVPLGLLPYGLWRLGGKESSSGWDLWLPGTAAFTGLALGCTAYLKIFSESSNPADEQLGELSLIGILVGALSSGGVILWNRRQLSAKCPCCQQPLGKRTYFCPRGGRANGHIVCAACWRPDNYRCKDCDWLRTPLLALHDDEWWTERLDKRSRAGQCSACGLGAGESDLRPCRQCTRPMCINCWDMENGRCVKCSWVIEGLPESLTGRFEMSEEKMDRGIH